MSDSEDARSEPQMSDAEEHDDDDLLAAAPFAWRTRPTSDDEPEPQPEPADTSPAEGATTLYTYYNRQYHRVGKTDGGKPGYRAATTASLR